MIQLAIFAKYWQPGAVKTRLARSLGAEQAAELFRMFVCCLVQRFARFGDDRLVCFTPAESRERFATMLPERWGLECQGQGHIGARMRDHFVQSKANHKGASGQFLLIGADAPTLPCKLLEEAVAALETKPVVFGPSDDGGYCLIGLRQDAVVPPVLDCLFGDLPWSTPTLLGETIDQLDRSGIPYATIDPWYDVDDMSSLRRLHAELQSSNGLEQPLEQLRSLIDGLLEQ